jgi:hypothetical protein
VGSKATLGAASMGVDTGTTEMSLQTFEHSIPTHGGVSDPARSIRVEEWNFRNLTDQIRRPTEWRYERLRRRELSSRTLATKAKKSFQHCYFHFSFPANDVDTHAMRLSAHNQA